VCGGFFDDENGAGGEQLPAPAGEHKCREGLRHWGAGSISSRLDRLRAFGQLFDEDLRVATALVVFLAPGGREVIGRALAEAALGLEIVKACVESVSNSFNPSSRALFLHKLNQLAADAWFSWELAT